MAIDTTNYQCPRCTGPLHFDSASGNVCCEYCDAVFSIQEIEDMFHDKNEANKDAQEREEAKIEAEAAAWSEEVPGGEWGDEGAHLRTFQCPSCGAQLDCDETTAATECPYCGNPTIIPGQLSGSRKADYVIPFKISRQQALDALHRHYGGKKLLPKLFTEESHLEKVQGVYVPFWLYDGEAEGAVTYSGEHTRMFREGNTEVTEVTTYQLFREGHIAFEHLPVDASMKMDDALMDSLEPYDMQDLKPFSFSYLPGYLADHFDVEMEECAKRADQRARNTTMNAFRRTTDSYENVSTLAKNIQLVPKGAHCALLPVWLLTTRWNDQTYTFAMNGQTGKLVGDLPMDNKAYWRMRLIYAAAIGLGLYAVQWIMALL